MRICIISPIYPTCSNQNLGIFVHEQAKYLAKSNEVCVITQGTILDKDFEIKDNINIYRIKIGRVPCKNVLYAFSTIKKLISLNKEFNFELVHSHFIGLSTALIGFASKFIKKPLVSTSHGIGLITENYFKKKLIGFYLRFPSKIICVSNYVSRLTSQYVNSDKLVVINNGVDPEKLKPDMTIPAFKNRLGLKDEKVLLSVGNLVERKGIDIIIKSLNSVVKSYGNIKYFIIGNGPEKQNLLNLVQKFKLEKDVVFVGNVGNNDLANFYNICDIFILMSRTIKKKQGIEGFGIVYAEASFFGKPVIGGKSGGTADSIVDNVTGYRVEPTNQKELANKIVKLLKNNSLRKRLGDNGKKRVQTNFLWKHNVGKLLKVYKSLLD